MLSSGTSDTRGAVGVEGWPSWGVDIGWTYARCACEKGVTENTTDTNYLAVCAPRVSEFPECRNDKGM